ncbi:DUF2723 domain-containing protein, partial [Xanthovirga aplysinae]|uniref:DUF2723 domain-containing protein n=1 Tax=Xanthovirga aplysinae TaxID=2529853 RepID=UPI001656AC94
IYYSIKKNLPKLNTAFLGLTFLLIGYSSYTLVAIRSNYNPPIDENNPENIMNMLSYLKREQYGSRPLIYGQNYTAEVVDRVKTPIYVKGKESYEASGNKINYVYDPADLTILPRVWAGNDPKYVKGYEQKLGLRPGEKPNFFDNIRFMVGHQIGHMYLRYFMWNFAGKESDIQGAGWLAPWDSLEKVPEVLARNKARNQYFMLPLILGLIGMFLQYKKDKQGFWIVTTLFVMLGFALVFYMNSPPSEPRERFYIYIGSFFAFTIWIGLGVMGVGQWMQRFFPSKKGASLTASLIGLSIPVLMAYQGWDDHDRSDRYFSVDSAKNYLASCAPNAILFTAGDNDTFPLWYAQEVEGFRTDVRVVVGSYSNSDWYIEQMRKQMNESKPLPFTLEQDDYSQGGPNNYLPYVENPNIKGAINLKQYLGLVKERHKALNVAVGDGDSINIVPSKNFFLEVDTTKVLNSGIIPGQFKSNLQDNLLIRLKENGLQKKDLVFLDLLVSSNWERPIYMNYSSLMGLGVDISEYAVQEGNVYRILPVISNLQNEQLVNTDIMYENLMQKMYWRELNNPKVYYDENYREVFINRSRGEFNSLASALVNEGKKEKAREVLLKSLELMPEKVVMISHTGPETVRLLLAVGEEKKAMEITEVIGKRAEEFLVYSRENEQNPYNHQKELSLFVLSNLRQIMNYAGKNDLASQYE